MDRDRAIDRAVRGNVPEDSARTRSAIRVWPPQASLSSGNYSLQLHGGCFRDHFLRLDDVLLDCSRLSICSGAGLAGVSESSGAEIGFGRCLAWILPSVSYKVCARKTII